MPYIGNTAADRFVASKAASVYSGDGSTTAFTLEHSVGADEDILVSVDGVIQEPSVAYAVSSGTTLTFTAAPSTNSGNNIFVYYLFRTVATVDHPSTSALSATSGTFSTDLTVDTDTLKVDSTNDLVGINTATPSDMYYNELVVNSGDEGGITILDSSSGQSALAFGDGTSGDARYRGRILYDHSTDSLSIGTAGEQYWTMNSAHIITAPKQPAFQATLNGHQSNIAVGSAVTVLFATEIFDQNADYDTSTYTFTAPVAGRYQFNVQIMLATLDSANAYYQTQLITSNRTHYHTFDPDYGQDNSYDNVTIATLTDMDANDTAIVKILQASGTQQTDLDNISAFSGYLVA